GSLTTNFTPRFSSLFSPDGRAAPLGSMTYERESPDLASFEQETDEVGLTTEVNGSSDSLLDSAQRNFRKGADSLIEL
ncbi:MAG TPA: hypothetical protein VEW48_27185, partial [Thermoanaerobaculia bacterium]|nr:hypothetical protein [Thermoanaerobaculia bacterium]